MIYSIKRFTRLVESCQLTVVSHRVFHKLSTNNYLLSTILVLICQLSTVNCQLFSQEFGLGLNLDDAAYESVPLKKSELKRSYSFLPSKVDLHIYAPPVQAQGKTNTCTGWALGYAACTIQEAALNKILAPSDIEKMASSPDYVYINGKTADVEGCSASMTMEVILKNVKGHPIPRKNEFNKFCAGKSAITSVSATGVKIIDYQRLFDDKDEWQIKIDNIRKVLADNRPVIVGMCVFNSFTKVKDVWDGKNDGYYGCHALCIVGYDNDFLGGAFEVMNSWGTGWGDQGFAWITYETLKKTQSLQRAFEITLSGQEKRVRNQASDVGKNKAQILDKFTSNISFKLDDGTLMPIEIKTNKSRGLIVVKKDSLKNRSEESVEKSENKNMGHSPLTTLNSNNFISYASEKSYTSGTQYRAYIEVSHPTYLYVLGSDNTGEFSILFPADAKTSDFLSTKNCAIALPDENSLIQMDNTIGTDFMYFVYSNQKLDPNMLVSELKGKKGNANQKITERFKSALSKSKPLEIDDKNISFKTDNTDDKFFIISLEIDHK